MWNNSYGVSEPTNTKGGVDEACHDVEATTTFIDSGNVVRGSFDTRVLEDNISMKLQNISDFLQKPYLVGNYTWSTSSIKNASLVGLPIGAYLEATSYWTNKLQGFSLVRGTACFRVTVNANPFQQGRLLAHFLPNQANRSANYTALHNATIATKRQQPCVEIDCRDAVGVLEVPYISPMNWWSRYATTKMDWGTFYLSVLSPLATGSAGETTVDVSVYLYFCDAEVAAPLVPQTGGSKSNRKFKAKTYSRKDISTVEAEAMPMKPLSSALKTASGAASILGGIPVLSSVAEPAAWALDLAAGVASFLGWSKPMNNIQPGVVSQQYNRYLATSDGVDSGYPLALRSDNKISVTDSLSVHDADEMSMAFLKKVTTCTETKTWATTDISNTSLYTKVIGPSYLYEAGSKTVSTHTANYKCGPPIFYLHNMFNLWRGGIEVTIKIIKTEMHTGRLQLTWSPNLDGVATVPTTTTGIIALREIIDVREGSVYTFTLPYLLATHYADTQYGSGTLDIKVLSELRAPETCSSVVELLIYYNGADDFEFQAPGISTIRDARLNMPFSPETADEEVVVSGVGGESAGGLTTLYGQAVCGEAVCSLKQFLARSCYVDIPTSLPTSANNASVEVWPWFSGMLNMDSVAGTLLAGGPGADPYSLISPMFAFYRGGVNLTFTTCIADTGNVTRNSPVVATLLNRDHANSTGKNPIVAGKQGLGYQAVTDPTSATTCTAGLNGYAISNAGVGMLTVRVPYYCRTKCSLARQQSSTTYIPADESQPYVSANFTADGAFNKYALFRSFPDDFQLTYFIGCPPLFDSYT